MRKSNLYAAIMLLMIPAASHCMGRIAGAVLAWGPTLTVAAAHILMDKQINHALKHNPSSISPEKTPEDFTHFVHEQCKAVGITDPSNIKVILQNDQSMPDAQVLSKNGIAVGRYTKMNYYDKAMNPKTDKKEAEDLLNQLKYVLQHEASHIKNNDQMRLIASSILIPCATHVIFSMIPGYNIWGPITTLASLLGKYTIVSGALKGLINCACLVAYNRHIEQQADDGIQNRQDILQGGIDTNANQSAHVDLFHPSPKTRIEKLKKRLAALKTKE